MPVQILTSVEDGFDYCNNRAYLVSALGRGRVRILREPVNTFTPPPFVFNTIRVYDFARSAGARIRDSTSAFLNNVLPGLQIGNHPKMRAAFHSLFNHYEFNRIYQQQVPRSMEMLIFHPIEQYVAHVYFNSLSFVTRPGQYDVIVSVTCQRYTYFPLQATNNSSLDAAVGALQNLHIANITAQSNQQHNSGLEMNHHSRRRPGSEF